jgi:Rad3-related DNA helicase
VLEGNDLLFLRKIGIMDMEKISEASTKFMNKNKTENCYLLAVDEFLHDVHNEKEHTHFVIERKGSLTITVQPLNPADMTSNVLSQVHSAVLMSGTLLPLAMFSDVFGVTQLNAKFSAKAQEEAELKNNSLGAATALSIHQKELEGQNSDALKVLTKEYKSPFPKENRLNLIATKTTTKYTARSSTQYFDIAGEIDKIVSKVPGNTIVFFPSFELMYSISNLLKTRRQVLKQEREMTQDDKTKLVNKFKTLGSGFGGVLLAVSGGSIAEGLDFPGDYLSCAIIVGIPFAKMNIYSNALINYCEKKFRKGWDYAYNAPAINKAMQAAGRVIRTETDRGVCVFLDERFGEDRYKRFYPKDFVAIHTKEPEKEVEEFFKMSK